MKLGNFEKIRVEYIHPSKTSLLIKIGWFQKTMMMRETTEEKK